MGDPSKIRVGPGLLYVAPPGTDPPTDLVTPWATVDPLWTPLGYTEEGHEATIAPNFEPIEVAEELTPVRYEETSREVSLAFAAAEITARNLEIALNGGTLTVSGVGPARVVKFSPPALGSVTEIMFGWQSNDGEERWWFYKCTQTGSVAIARRKAPNKATIPMDFRCVVPGGGLPPFDCIISDPA